MRKILYLFLFITSAVYGQEVEIGTVFTIEFNNPKTSMEFNLVSKKPYEGIIDYSKTDSVFIKNKPAENQIIGIFANGKFGDGIGTMLVLVSGLNESLNYDLQIKTSKNGEYQNTSTSPLLKGVKSLEYWPYKIDKVNFSAFKVMPSENLKNVHFEEEIDSTCIKNAGENLEQGELEFKSYFKSITLQFESGNEFRMDTLLEHEKSINSKNVSLGHYWSLGNDIYPNKKRFKFGDPYSFKRVECPYFKVTTEYIFTKTKRDVKVVAFNWNVFEESNLRANPQMEKDGHLRFIEKYDFLVAAVSEVLGQPLAIEQEKNSGRVDTKWHSINGINAYLFRFTNYDEIRLYIYKE